MTQHNTTQHNTTQHNTTNNRALRVAVIGSLDGVMYVADSIGQSAGYMCALAVAENYPGKNFFRYLSSLGLKEKLKRAVKGARFLRALRKSGKNTLSKIPQVYFVSQQAILRSFDWIPPKAFEDIDLFLVACEDNDSLLEYKSSDYISGLLRHGIARDKIFIVPPVVYKAELPIIENGKLSPVCSNVNDVKPLLRYMEYHITDFCNLKCKGCGHLANRVKELEFSDIGEFRLALAGLAEKFSNINILRLMGGEPLLCKNLHEYINAVHEIFPYCQIKIVTNGLLYANMTRETIDAVRNAKAEIQVTQYPPTRKIAGEIVAFCEKNGMKLRSSRPLHEFFRHIASDKNADAEKCWLACGSRYCHFLHGTNFHPCPRLWTAHEPKFSEFLTKAPVTESEYSEFSYDMTQNISDDGWDILAKFENPMELCRKCGDKKVMFKWESEIPEYNK